MTEGPDGAIWIVSYTGQMQRFDPITSTFSNVIDLPTPQDMRLLGARES